MGIKDAEPAPRDKREQVAAAESQVGVRREHGILHEGGLVAIGIHRVGRQVIGEERVVRGKGSGNDLEDAHARARQSSVDAPHKPTTITNIRPVEQSSLLGAAPELAAPDDFERVGHATAKFSFSIGAARHQGAGQDENSQEGDFVTHTLYWFANARFVSSKQITPITGPL
ncbi:hypothetical protein SBV1_310026 [Verrucomicrobia bacterium]|nr:hypothetical protein SBV1_310026 [Verrucomicrobiota bacterium]